MDYDCLYFGGHESGVREPNHPRKDKADYGAVCIEEGVLEPVMGIIELSSAKTKAMMMTAAPPMSHEMMAAAF